MKKLLTVLLILALLLPAAALSDLPDISGLSYDELIELKEQINLAIWNCEEWQEVTVQAGIWVIGEDIPEGHWTIRAIDGGYYIVEYCNKLNDTGTGSAWDSSGWCEILSGRDDDEMHQFDIEMKAGMYFINDGPIVFTPYTGKPDLGFK